MTGALGHSYGDSPGLANRANSALLRIDLIISDLTVPPEVRLVRVAEVMAGEPVLTDGSTAAHRARRAAKRAT